MHGRVFLILCVLAAIVTAMAVVGTVLVVRVIVTVSPVFRGDENYGASSANDSEDNSTDSENDNGVFDDASPSSGSEFQSNCSAKVGMADAPSSFSFLPPFNVVGAPNFTWGDVPGESFVHGVTCCYDEVVHWRKVFVQNSTGKVW